MADVSTAAFRTPVALALWLGAGLWLAGCESLLDLPDNPRLAEDTPAVGASGSEEAAGSGDEREAHDEPWPAENEPPVGSGPMVPAAIDVPPSQGVGSGAANELDDGASVADAGAKPPEDAADPVPQPEPAIACAAGETAGPDARCYIVLGTLRSWEESRAACVGRGEGWDLAAVRSPAVNELLGDMGAGEAWIGASDEEEEGTWLWVNEQVPFWSGLGVSGNSLNGEFENWNSDEPNGRATSNCARLVVPRASNAVIPELPTWADLECFELLAAVCEGPALPTGAGR